MSPQVCPPPPDRDTVAARIAALPSLPSVAAELLSGDAIEELDVAPLARRIAADQVLAARALRVANSPFYGMPGMVGSIQEAIVVLGFRAVRSLVISAAAVQALASLKPGRNFSPRTFWRHSVGTAVAARHLAMLSGRNAEAAFTAGLLHDIGQLVLCVAFPRHYAAVLARSQGHELPLVAAELEYLGLTHAEAGAMRATRWGLPQSMREAIALHHQPDEARADSLVDLTHVANVLAHGLEFSTPLEEPVPPLSDTAWNRLNIDWARLAPTLDQIANEFEDTLHALLA